MQENCPTYEIHPRRNGEGFDLIGPHVPPRLWRVADYAEGYAAMLAKTRGGIVRVYDEMGELVREHSDGGVAVPVGSEN